MKLYAYDKNGALKEVPEKSWSIKNTEEKVSRSDVVEIWMECEDEGEFNLSAAKKTVKISALLTSK